MITDIPESLHTVLAQHICNTLQVCNGNKTKASKMLEITPKSLSCLIERYKIKITTIACFENEIEEEVENE